MEILERGALFPALPGNIESFDFYLGKANKFIKKNYI